MKEIKKISISRSSGWGTDLKAFDEKLTLTDHSITFKHTPYKINEERLHLRPAWNQEEKWSYKTDSIDFSNQFLVIGDLISELFLFDPSIYFCTDVGLTNFTISFVDGHKEEIGFFYDGDLFFPIWRAIRELIPPVQDIPALLYLPKTDED